MLFSILACVRIDPSLADSVPVNHEKWDLLLKKHVDEQGLVDYRGFIRDSVELARYVNYLGTNAPNNQNWSMEEKLAYYINLYNAATIQLVIRNYPLKSIMDIGSVIQIPFVNTPWQVKFITIAGEKYDLDNIEHNIIRKGFQEPRIHFALVCAAMSCPKLRNEAFVADKLEAQLTEQTRQFLSSADKNILSKDRLELSSIFQWFSGDFTKNGSIQSFVNKYTEIEIAPDASIDYLDYDWALNEMQ